MLCNLDDVIGVPVLSVDGEIGKIRNFLFDDRTWIIRYLVVDVGTWLSRTDVLVSVTAIDQPDWHQKIFRTRLTRDQVRRSPDVDLNKPVSRQQEIAMREHFGWTGYWEEMAEVLNAQLPISTSPAGQHFPVAAGDDPHLRSVDRVASYEVWAGNGEIGRLENFIADDASWHVGYLAVKMGDWLRGRSMLVPTSSVTSVSWENHRVNLDRSRERL